jgi:DNA-binding XRE family transcriptional regulator
MSQAMLAKKVGISRGSLANIEGGHQRVMLHDIMKFAEALKCRPQKLLAGIFGIGLL